MTAFSPLADANEEFIITPNVPNRSLPYLQGVASPASVVYEGTCGSSLSKNAFSASFFNDQTNTRSLCQGRLGTNI